MKIPRDQIRKSALIDDNTLVTFEVEDFVKGETRGSEGAALPAGTRRFHWQMRITDPPAFAEVRVFDSGTVGTEDDPLAEDPDTWTSAGNKGAQQVRDLLDAIGVMTDDDDLWSDQAIDQQGQALVSVYTPNKGPYKDVPQNRFKYYPVGQAPIRQTGKAGMTRPIAARPVAPTQAQAPAAAKAASVAPARRVAQPPAPAGPNGPAATAQRPSVAKPATVSKGAQAIPCVLCQDAGEADFMIPRAEFQGHYAQHLAQQTSGEE